MRAICRRLPKVSNSPILWDRVADLYDAYVRTELDVPFFLASVREVRGEVLELMSGTGRVSLPLVEAGVRLTCVDYSAEMLKALEQKLAARKLRAALHVQDVRALDLGKTFDLIFIPFHAFAELTNPADQRQTLTRIHQHLAANGRFICTLHNPHARKRSIDGQLHLVGSYPRAGGGHLLFWLQQKYVEGERVVSAHEFFEEYDAHWAIQRRRQVALQFALIEFHMLRILAGTTGLTLRRVYGNYDKSPFQEQTSPFIIAVMEKA